MADWLLEKLVEKFIDIGCKYLQDHIRWQTGMKTELERLRNIHPKIQAVVSATNQVQKIDPDSTLNKWIWQLRDAIDEADDVLDDFQYTKHEEQLAMEKSKVASTMSNLKNFGKRALRSDPSLSRLEQVLHKLDKILVEVNTFRDLLKDAQQEQKVQQDKLQNDRETGSMPNDVLIGRGKDKEFIVQWLKKLPNEEHQSHVSAIPNMYHNISLLSIVGHGGMGKTALLQHIYKDEVIEEFDLKMWICVSNNFDVKEVIKNMLESLTKTRPSSELLDILQNKLQSEVTSKKFLLVLDDIWEENEVQDKIKWGKVFSPLNFGGLGSKILITTRTKCAASLIAKVINKKNEQLMLEGLEKEECLQLLNTHAFAGEENPDDLKKLRSITEELVKKLYGSPLAAKVIGGVLNSNLDEREWTNILNNVMRYNDMFPILKLSYIFLPKYLQNCFAFCSIFAQDHVFDKDELVRMWIAVGFIQPSNIQGEDLEDTGRRYIDILVKKSFFEKDERGYKMHDLLHDLAQSVSAQECFRIVGDEDSVLDIPITIRHLFVETKNLELLKKLEKFKKLRTLCIRYVSHSPHFVDVLTKIIEETRSIRLFSIHISYYHEMKPKAIRCLKHLRYLEIKFDDKFRLPRSVCNLFHLQFLICKRIDDLPRDINNLSNLRYARLPHYKSPGIGKLKFLQELNEFVVENKTGHRIVELKHMNDLRILKIKCLESVRDAEEACNAKLCDKKKLTDLSLEWSWKAMFADRERYATVLDNLQPHNNIKKLTMQEYMGDRSAIWMNNVNLINNLEHIKLDQCSNWQNLPPLGQLPFLKSLHLCKMPKAVRFDTGHHDNGARSLFPSLEVLSIVDLEALEDWFDAGVDCLFPRLTELKLYNCPNLRELPYLPPKLQILSMSWIRWKALNYCSSVSKSIPLKKLEVNHCRNIAIIPLNSEIIGRTATIRIVYCPNLLSLGGDQEVRTAENCPNLILDSLTVSDPSVLQMEPLRSFTSIKKLIIEKLP